MAMCLRHLTLPFRPVCVPAMVQVWVLSTGVGTNPPPSLCRPAPLPLFPSRTPAPAVAPPPPPPKAPPTHPTPTPPYPARILHPQRLSPSFPNNCGGAAPAPLPPLEPPPLTPCDPSVLWCYTLGMPHPRLPGHPVPSIVRSLTGVTISTLPSPFRC